MPAIGLCGLLPLKYELACRQTFFIDNCLKSVNSVVKFVARNGVYFSSMYSPIGRSAQFAVYFLRFSYVILEVLIEDCYGSL